MLNLQKYAFFLHAQFETAQQRVGAKMEDRCHFACHAKAALSALIGAIAHAQTATAIGIDEIGDEAFFSERNLPQSVAFHLFQSRKTVHYWVTAVFVSDHFIDDGGLLFGRQSQIFGAWVWRVKIDGNLLDGVVVAHIFHGCVNRFVVERVHHHVHADVFLTGFGNVFLQSCKSAIAPNALVIFAYAVHRNPDGVRVNPRKILLRVGRYGYREEADFARLVDDVVDGAFALAPKRWFAAFEVDKPRTLCVGVAHVAFDVGKGALMVACAAVDRTVFAAQIAFVGDEKHSLQWRAPSEKSRPNEPLSQVKVLLKHNFSEE